jgi:hypothetical protein
LFTKTLSTKRFRLLIDKLSMLPVNASLVWEEMLDINYLCFYYILYW